MAISENIEVDAGEAIASVDDLATAFEELADKASAAIGKIDSALDGLGGGSAAAAGPDKLVAAWDKAADSVSAAADKIAESIGKIGDIGAVSSAAGPDKLAASWDDAAASISASVDKIAGAGAKIDDLGAGAAGAAGPVGDLGKALDDTAAGADKLGASAAPAADGLKGIGDSAKESQAFLDEYNATLAETAAMAREASAASADASAKIAMSQRLNTAAMKDASDDAVAAQAAQADSAKQAAADADAAATKYHMLALGGAVAIGYGIDQAAKLQTQVTRLYTSAGESQANLPLITRGILGMAGPTATDQSQLASGAYWVESAGFHGQSALNVLRAVAQGAYAEGAPIQDVANAATSIMTSYGMTNPSQQQSNSVINMMLQAVGHGKMTMAGLSAALPSVLPVASSAGLSLPQVLGSLATMTAPGMSADRASQNLAHTIGKLQNPTQAMTAEMYQLGLDPVSMAQNLGKTGISGEMQEIQRAIQAHTITSGADKGMVQLPAMNISKSAQQDALLMLKQMPPAIQATAKAYLDGKISAAAWNQEMFKGSESASAKNLLQQFSTVANLAHGYNAALKAGQPDVQAYNAAVSKTLGDSVAMRTYLELTGQHAKVTAANIATVGQAAKDAGQNVQGWSDITKTAGFQLKSFEYSAKATATTMGAALLPVATDVMTVLAKTGSFLAANPALTKDLAIGGGVLGAAAIIPKVASAGATALSSVGKIAETLHIPGLDKLANIGQGSGLDASATRLDASATSLDGAADALSGAAEKLSTVGGPGGMPGGTPGREESTGETATADAEDVGGAGGFLAGIKAIPGAFSAAAGTIAQGVALGAIIKGIGDQIAPAGSQAGTYNKMLQKTPATNDSSLMPDIFGGFEGKLMSSIGLGVGGAISKFIDGTQTSSVNAAQSRFSSRFGVPAPGTATTAAPSAAPVAATQRPDLLGVGGHPGTVSLGTVDTSSLDAAKSKVQADIKAIDSVFAEAKAKGITIPAPDLSALESAKSKLKSDMDGINQELAAASGKPSKIAAPDLSQVEAAKGKALSDATAIVTGLQSALNKQVRAAPPDLGPFAAAAGQARGDGVNITLGLASGINAEAGAAEAAAQAVASQVAATMAHALQTRSPSKVTEVIGKDTSAGLAKGITEGTSAVKASAVSLSASTVTSLTTGLQGGTDAINAALQAISGKGSRPQDITNIINTISTLKGDVAQALSAGQITKPEDSALVKMLDADNTKLQALATRRTMLETEITDAQQITQQALTSANITNAGTYTPVLAGSSGPLAASATITGMQGMAADQAQFAKVIGQLKKQGLNATDLNQFIQAGTSSLPQALGLEQGGKAAIQQVNKLQAQLKASADQLGDEGAGSMYQAGVQAGQGVAEGIKSQLGAVDAAMKQIATAMTSALDRDLGTKAKTAAKSATSTAVSAAASSSTAATSGSSTGTLVLSVPGLGKLETASVNAAGALNRVTSGGDKAASALERLAAAASKAASGGTVHPVAPVAHGGGGSGGGAGSGGVTVQMSIQGSVLSEQDLVAAVLKAVQKHGSNNWQAGVVLPGRAA